ncbi:MAG: hypothetical protein HKP18_02655 [Acidimicrobiia bacterium]|nr:hypothetical protein [Acidimicrobiia bacterium]
MADEEAPAEADAPPAPRFSGWKRGLGIAASLAIAVGLLVGVLPAIANIGEVWDAIQTLTWLESGSLLLLAAWNIAT